MCLFKPARHPHRPGQHRVCGGFPASSICGRSLRSYCCVSHRYVCCPQPGPTSKGGSEAPVPTSSGDRTPPQSFNNPPAQRVGPLRRSPRVLVTPNPTAPPPPSQAATLPRRSTRLEAIQKNLRDRETQHADCRARRLRHLYKDDQDEQQTRPSLPAMNTRSKTKFCRTTHGAMLSCFGVG